MELPFELKRYHKADKRCSWKKKGLNMENFEEIYQKYIYCKECELCGKEFTKTIDRQMEHCHETGEFRNIVCNKCNQLKSDNKVQRNNISGFRHIHKQKMKECKQGFYWCFKVTIEGKVKKIKSSTDLEKLVEFRDKWIKENNYYT